MRILAENVIGEVIMSDPSEYRPEHKDLNNFRNYTNDNVKFEEMKRLYKEMHSKQTVSFNMEMINKWCHFDHAEMTIMEAILLLDNLRDESDPDIDLPNSVHAFQTAERIREQYPNEEWFIFTGLIHDVGKIMAVFGEQQFAVVGDTFPVGCPPSSKIVFAPNSFSDNIDIHNPLYNSWPCGMYTPGAGLDNVTMSWGHDEYLYRVLQYNGHNLPQDALSIIRYHSFYPWHTSGAYQELCSPEDQYKRQWVCKFNSFDLYSKSEIVPDVPSLVSYYQGLVDKFLPGTLKW